LAADVFDPALKQRPGVRENWYTGPRI
jgi:hypothetical protein